MPIQITVRKNSKIEVRSVNCPVCFTGQMKYIIRKIDGKNKKIYDFECSICKTVGNSDWFDLMGDSKINVLNRMSYHVGIDKMLPMC
jgi:hypothetical protein